MTEYSSLVEILQNKALEKPNNIAYRFLQDGQTESGSLTYSELDRQAKAIAAELQSLLQPGSRALLVYPYHAGLEFISSFFGCLYAGIIAVTTNPPRHGKEVAKLLERATASGAKVVITTAEFLKTINTGIAINRELATQTKDFIFLATDTLPSDLSTNWQATKIERDTLAFLQYTSGSTGISKGVMVTHGNLIANEEMIRQGFQHTEETIVVGWLPMFHDMGLIGNVLQPLYLGTPSILMSPVSLAQKPFEWLKAISHYQATSSGGPNFAYDLLCLKATPENLAGLDLSSWSVAFSGAETVRAETIDRFSHIFKPCGFRREAFYPCYGMAETTLLISGGLRDDPPVIKYVDGNALEQNRVVAAKPEQKDAKAIVGCGRTWLDQKAIIVDPQSLTQCSSDGVGEIWVSGSGVGKGYWQQPEETENTFNAYLADTKEGPFLRTGDLGFIEDGELYITGRLKEVMIFWGRYCYPQHVEKTVQDSHPALRPNCGAAFSLDVDTTERLVIVQEVERSYLRKLNIEEIVEVICQSVGQVHEVEAYAIALLKTGSIPKTSSGKIQRRGCKAQFLSGDLNIVAKWQQSHSAGKNVTEIVNLSD
ncbi:MAG: fatty acyl-AMP ligase [Xenococcaceae cyanobacterium MO_188.B29]|nr:fatty acyl-AMP ligase [Xenococcaceae cyanobacterium MO_188.B29]